MPEKNDGAKGEAMAVLAVEAFKVVVGWKEGDAPLDIGVDIKDMPAENGFAVTATDGRTVVCAMVMQRGLQ